MGSGLPNITGGAWDIYGNYEGGVAIGGNSFKGKRSGYRESVKNNYNEWQTDCYDGFDFNASWANSIYGKASIVQPPALKAQYFIKY